MDENPETASLTELQTENRQLLKELLAERILRIDIQVQLLGIMRQEAVVKLQSVAEAATPQNPE